MGVLVQQASDIGPVPSDPSALEEGPADVDVLASASVFPSRPVDTSGELGPEPDAAPPAPPLVPATAGPQPLSTLSTTPHPRHQETRGNDVALRRSRLALRLAVAADRSCRRLICILRRESSAVSCASQREHFDFCGIYLGTDSSGV